MNEDYLHFLWMRKNIPVIGLELVNGQKIDIVHFGFYNRNQSGPDFSMGIVHLDGNDLIGPIELHVKSSDWYRHKHHLDPAYDNVILHVVFEYDKEIIQNGRVLPTLELKSFIDPVHQLNYSRGRFQEKPICSSILTDMPEELEAMKEKALLERMDGKVHDSRKIGIRSSGENLLYWLAKAFGTTVNKDAFIALSERLPLSVLKTMDKERCFDFVKERSAYFSKGDNHAIGSQWERSGVRPQNYPEVRIAQFAACVAVLFGKSGDFRFISTGVATDFEAKLKEVNNEFKGMIVPLSGTFIDHLLINTYIPFVYSQETDNEVTKGVKVIEELRGLKKENNRSTRFWAQLGMEIKSAYDSQAFLALNTYFCSRKKCLSCDVGKRYLNKVNDTENSLLF